MPYRFVQSLFFGNYFYGLCTVLLSVEGSVQQFSPLNQPGYYLGVFAATVLYYTKAYMHDTSPGANVYNERTLWYAHNKKSIYFSQIALAIILALCMVSILVTSSFHWQSIPVLYWFLLAIFPTVAALYYGVQLPSSRGHFNLRDTGWLKPFVIGFVWAGVVTVYPLLFRVLFKHGNYVFHTIAVFLFIKNFMFITVLCIMFDIKDYVADHNRQLKTFVVRLGLRKTIFYILLPLCIIGLGTFLGYAFTHHFPATRIVFNTIPFILLITVAYSMQRRKGILYYLAIIDGLMLAKAVCGILGMLV
ncbi:hypothetical protein [Parasediminibacterium sp. JCM 36343]|uniref:hypothetical protein n=1 Tax=Parasediminibacterium sp. JCM 36343 TaxID=3374279 RepID=UPI00397D81C1